METTPGWREGRHIRNEFAPRKSVFCFRSQPPSPAGSRPFLDRVGGSGAVIRQCRSRHSRRGVSLLPSFPRARACSRAGAANPAGGTGIDLAQSSAVGRRNAVDARYCRFSSGTVWFDAHLSATQSFGTLPTALHRGRLSGMATTPIRERNHPSVVLAATILTNAAKGRDFVMHARIATGR